MRGSFGLVGADRHRHAFRTQLVEARVDAVERSTAVADVRGVEIEEDGETAFHILLRSLTCRREALAQQGTRAVTDHLADVLRVEPGSPERRQRMIERRGEVRRSVGKGAVEIEDDDVEGEARHERRHLGRTYGNRKFSMRWSARNLPQDMR